jgi:hypothetical protein
VDQYFVPGLGQLAEKASCPQGLVDIIGGWKNGPAYSN